MLLRTLFWVSIKQSTVTRKNIHNTLIQLVVDTPYTSVKKTKH